MKKFEVFVGLNDADTYEQTYHLDDVRKYITEAYMQEKIDFSAAFVKGGYLHENGDYILENSILYTFIGDYTKEDADAFFEEVKRTINQESILVCETEIDNKYM